MLFKVFIYLQILSVCSRNVSTTAKRTRINLVHSESGWALVIHDGKSFLKFDWFWFSIDNHGSYYHWSLYLNDSLRVRNCYSLNNFRLGSTYPIIYSPVRSNAAAGPLSVHYGYHSYIPHNIINVVSKIVLHSAAATTVATSDGHFATIPYYLVREKKLTDSPRY